MNFLDHIFQFLFIPCRYVFSHDQYNVHEFMNLDQRTHEKVHIFVQQKSDRFVKHFSTSPYTPKPIISWEKTILNIYELLSDICFHHFLSTHVFPLISSPVTFYRAEWFPEKFPIKSRSLSYARCPRESNFKTTNWLLTIHKFVKISPLTLKLLEIHRIY